MLKHQRLFNSYKNYLQVDPIGFESAVKRDMAKRTGVDKEFFENIINAVRLEVALNPEETQRKRLEAQKHEEEVIKKYRVEKISDKKIQWFARDAAGAQGWIDVFVAEGKIEVARRIKIQLEKNRKEQS